MALGLVLTPLLALGGDLHTADFAATVRSAKRVTKAVLPDRLATLTDEAAKALAIGEACEVRLAVEDPFFRRDQSVFTSAAACARLKPGTKVRVEFFGLATSFQFVSLEVDGRWYSLPMMRVTHSTNSLVHACLTAADGGEGAHCTPRNAPPL